MSGSTCKRRRPLGFALAIGLLLASPLPGQESREPPRADDWSGAYFRAPEPFTLNSYDVIGAVLRIRRSRLLLERRADGLPRIVAVESARSEWVGYDPDAFENHRNRYTVVLNGEPIDWDLLYIEYGGEMVSLRLLYTYRNQQPIPSIPYRLP